MKEATQSVANLTRERWEANAEYWVKIIREGRDRYRTELTDRAMLEAIGPCAGLRVLDAGCGEGYLARELAARGAEVVGVDASQGLIDAAEGHPDGRRGSMSFIRASVDAMPVEDAGFDLVVCNHLFSHLHDPGDAIREFGRVLRSGGRLIILTLHRASTSRTPSAGRRRACRPPATSPRGASTSASSWTGWSPPRRSPRSSVPRVLLWNAPRRRFRHRRPARAAPDGRAAAQRSLVARGLPDRALPAPDRRTALTRRITRMEGAARQWRAAPPSRSPREGRSRPTPRRPWAPSAS